MTKMSLVPDVNASCSARTSLVPDVDANGSGLTSPSFVCKLKAGEPDPTWVHVAGELDLAGAPLLEEGLRRALLRARLTVLDLRQLTFMDSSGVHVIVEAALRAARAKRRLTVVRGASQIDSILALTGASRVLDIVDFGPGDPHGGPLSQIVRSDAA